MNTFDFKRAVQFLLSEVDDDKTSKILDIRKTKGDEGNEKISIEIAGAGFNEPDSYLILSKEEADALKDLAKQFSGKRDSKLSKKISTTDSTISIEKDTKDPFKMVLARQEGSRFKGYDSSDGPGGRLVVNQSEIGELEKNL